MKHILLSMLVFASLPSCSKDDENSNASKTELLTRQSWKFEKAEVALFGDISSQIDPCIKDNILTFNANGSGNVNEGSLVCASSTAGNFTWSFQNNETLLNTSVVLFTGGSPNFNIVSLTATNLVVSHTLTIAPNPPMMVTITLKH